jgi:hypothetical protein
MANQPKENKMKIKQMGHSTTKKNKVIVAFFSVMILVFAVNCVSGKGGSDKEGSEGGSGTGCSSSSPSSMGANTTSTAAAVSHRAGEACLTCHTGAGGTKLFTLAGTLYTGTATNVIVAGGTVNADNIAMTTDTCGNFYKTSALTNADAPKPFVGVRTMGGGNTATGECNNAGCHPAGTRIW